MVLLRQKRLNTKQTPSPIHYVCPPPSGALNGLDMSTAWEKRDSRTNYSLENWKPESDRRANHPNDGRTV